MTNIDIVNPLDIPEWNDIILSNTSSSFFHTANWAKVLFNSYGYKPIYFVIVENGKLEVLIPLMEIDSIVTGKRGVSLPFSDCLGPIISEKYCLNEIIERIINIGIKSKWKYLEIRGGSDFILDDIKSTPYCNYYINSIDINKDPGALYNKFHRNVKKNINKSERSGIKVDMCKSMYALNEFYRLHSLNRKKHGVPPQPFYFFKNIYEYILKKDCGFITLALYKNECITAAMYFHFGNKIIHKYTGSDLKYQEYRANNLVIWETLRWCCNNGIEDYNFGRTDVDDEGLLKFKEAWGGNEYLINYYRYDLRKCRFLNEKKSIIGFANKIIKNIPLSISEKIGNILYPHIG